MPFLLALAMLVAAPNQDYVWWEGEAALETNFPKQSSFSASTFPEKRQLLSGGDWLTNDQKRTGDEGYARYSVLIPADGKYQFWVRKFWLHGPFRWKFGNQDWRICGRDVSLADEVGIRTHLGANWVYLGEVELGAGVSSFELRLLAGPGEALVACFDAFVLSAVPFAPKGKLKPGEKLGLADPGYFAFEPDLDAFRENSFLNLRAFNESHAGASGWVKKTGPGFSLGNGNPVRFWAVNVNAGHAGDSRSSVDFMAKKLAKMGVNMVRFHSAMFDDGASDPAKVSISKLDNLHYLVAAMKKQGIFTTLSLYFPLWFDIKPSYGIPGYDSIQNKVPFALLQFDPRMREIHRSWLRGALAPVNPYTGSPLAKDPALAVVEVQNEDSYFFWTFSKENIPAVQRKKLGKLFGDWLALKHGSVEKAVTAWGLRHEEDDPGAGVAGLFGAWDMTREGSRQGDAKLRRMRDQVRFLAEHQRGFYEGARDYLKKDLSYGGLVSASNWTVADPSTLDALERWTYTAGDLIDSHGYMEPQKHEGEGASYQLREGHVYQDRAMVLEPEKTGPLQFIQIRDFPHTISEINWTNPNRFRADLPFLAASYGSLQGVDGFYFFAVGSPFLLDQGWGKFPVSCPSIAWQFPAAALAYRRGDFKEADDVVTQHLSLQDLFNLEGSGSASAQSLDMFRAADLPPGTKASGEVKSFDPLSFFVGKVTRNFDGAKEKSSQMDLSPYVDRSKKRIKSLTGEQDWDFGTGLVKADSPRTQGACGFLAKAGRLEMSAVAIESGNEFGTILVTSLDHLPLKQSKYILIQAMTEEQPYGFKAEGGVIKNLGGAPLGVKKINARISFKLEGTGDPQARPLDLNGYAQAKVIPVNPGPGGWISLTLPEDTLYTLVTR